MTIPSLTAYTLHPTDALSLIPAPIERHWMEAPSARFARRCLPLLAANQAGWWVVTNREVRAIWNGSAGAGGLVIETQADETSLTGGHGASDEVRLREVTDAPVRWAASHFGDGILTWSLPWLFVTSPGWDLLVRGPANVVKDGIVPLEGLVETDWSPMTFTINWKFTRPGPVRFLSGEPIGQIVPSPRDTLPNVSPEVRPFSEAPEPLQDAYREWQESRAGFLQKLKAGEAETVKEGWQKEYLRQAKRQRRLVRPFLT